MIDKLQKRIRELAPELMELSFGCEVSRKFQFIGEKEYEYKGRVFSNTSNEDDGDFDHHKDYKDPIIRVIFNCFGGDCQTKIDSYKKSGLEIIGHPIHLEHVLQAIESNDIFICASYGYIGYSQDMCNGIFKVEYDLTKSFTNQSPELYEFLSDILIKE